MKIMLLVFAFAFVLHGCSNLPKPGWYTRNGSDEKVYSLFVGEENDIVGKFPGKFSKQDFIAAMSISPSAQYMTAGRPRYYAVLCDNPDTKANIRIITLEILERDYKK